jgi:hypothetical protein
MRLSDFMAPVSLPDFSPLCADSLEQGQSQPVPCRLCGHGLNGIRLDFGMMPITNRFTVDGDFAAYGLAMTACAGCGLIQLCNNPPVEMVSPRVPWIRYNEPEAHLDGVAAHLLALLPNRPCTALGVGPFDRPLLERLDRTRVSYEMLDLQETDSGETPAGRYPYLETVQARLRTDYLALLRPRTGRADIVVCRYLLEHCHDPLEAFFGLRGLLTSDGLLIIEVPDSSAFLARCDYSFVWEEHVSYFTETALRVMAARAGGEIAELIRTPGLLEDSILAVLRFPVRELPPCAADFDGVALFERYAAGFVSARNAWQARLANLITKGHRIAIFGAGHQAIMFVNILGLTGYIHAMIDDAPEKQGFIPPGLSAPIRPLSAMLADPDFTVCLLAINPASEARVLPRFAPLLDRSGFVYSIFRGPDDGPLLIEKS